MFILTYLSKNGQYYQCRLGHKFLTGGPWMAFIDTFWVRGNFIVIKVHGAKKLTFKKLATGLGEIACSILTLLIFMCNININRKLALDGVIKTALAL